MLSGIRKDDNGRYFLTFRSVEQEISPKTMISVLNKYGEVEIPTLDKDVILKRYYARTGFLKPKDIDKTNRFRTYINDHGNGFLDPTILLPYNEFCQRINEKHPIVVKISEAYWNFDQKIGGKISGSNGFFYNLIGNFRR
jgi:hypothetical protein